MALIGNKTLKDSLCSIIFSHWIFINSVVALEPEDLVFCEYRYTFHN